MAAKKAKLMVVVGADTKDYQKKMKAMSKNLDGLSQKLKGFGSGVSKAVGVGLAAAGAAMGAFVIQGVKDAAEAEEKLAQLDAVIASTGGAAGITRDEIVKMSDAFEQTTKFSAEMTQESAALLLTFTNIGKDVFPDATQATLDMATALGTDAAGQAIALGKALNDPKKGISALTRVGVTFTQEQKDVIESLQDTGDMAGAQRIILAELAKEFGGSATAAGKTFSGQLEIVRNRFGAVREEIGVKLMPYLMDFLNWVTENMPMIKQKITDFADKAIALGEDLAPIIKDIGGLAMKVVDGFVAMPPAAQKAALGFAILAGPSINLAGNLVSIVSSLLLMKARAPAAGAAMAAAGATAHAGWLPFFTALGAAATIIGGLSAAGYLAKKGGDMKSDRLLKEYDGRNSLSVWDEKAQDKVIDHINKIGGYANGGIVTRKTLAWVGEKEPEVITPLSKLRGAMSGGQTVNHTGSITVRGVNSRDELIGVTQILARDIAENDRRQPNRTKLMPF